MELGDPSDEPFREPVAGAERGCNLLQGPPHRLSRSWAVSVNGSEYVALLLWIGKDWSWSQLGWTRTAFFFGALAEIWIIHMTASAYQNGLYSETYKCFTLWLWLTGLFAWMIGEFWTLWYTDDIMAHAEERGNAIARWVLLIAVLLDAVFFLVLVPLDVFASDRQSIVLRRLEAKNPPCPRCVARYFREFRVYSEVHFFTWILKDCMWAWEFTFAYGVAFVITILLNLELLWRLGTHRDLYIDFVNYLVILLWVIANGLWAFGELVANYDATDENFRRYSWPRWQIIHGAYFHFRYAAGWIFLLSGLSLLTFYVHWIVATIRGKLPSYDDFESEVPFKKETTTAPGPHTQEVLKSYGGLVASHDFEGLSDSLDSTGEVV